MKKLFILPVFLCLVLSSLHGQDSGRISTSLVLISQGYVISSGLGFSNYTTSTVANIAAVNPASMADFTKPSAGISFLFATPIDSAVNLIRVEHSRVNPWLPQTFGFVMPYRNFRFGLGFNQKYSSSLNFGLFLVPTPGDPGGTGETIELKSDRYVYSGSGLVSYQFSNFINNDHHLSLGLQIDINFLRDYESLGRFSAEATDQSVTWKAGARYGFLDLLQSSVAFEKGADFSGIIEYSEEPFIEPPDSGINARPIESKFTAKLPDRLLIGLAFKINEKLRLANDFTYVYWEKIYKNVNNQLDISGNLYFLPSEQLSLSAGFYSTRREVNSPDVLDNFSDNNALFLSAAALVKVKSAAIEIMLADSHLFSSDLRKQFFARVGFGFSL